MYLYFSMHILPLFLCDKRLCSCVRILCAWLRNCLLSIVIIVNYIFAMMALEALALSHAINYKSTLLLTPTKGLNVLKPLNFGYTYIK